MTATDLITLLPLLIMAVTGLVVMLGITVHRSHVASLWLTVIGFILAFVSLFFIGAYLPHQVTPLLIIDRYTVYYLGLLSISGIFIALLSYGFIKTYQGPREEYYILLILSTLGAATMVASSHFASFLLGLEILSVALYGLIGYPRLQEQRLEAAVKYLILAGTTAAFLMFGMALVYAETGNMQFAQLASTSAGLTGGPKTIFMVGLGLIVVGLGFKLALVPFSLWVPDVYQGAPAPVTAFIATISKGGVFALMLRLFTSVSFSQNTPIWEIFAVISVLSMLIGNLLALRQNQIKRILAYSSIAHFGYLLIALLAGGALGQGTVAFYLAAYFITNLIAFGVVTVLSTQQQELDRLDLYRGLFWRKPFIAGIFTLALLSLAGSPPTAGLFAKIFVASAGVGSSLWLLLAILIIASIIGAAYYIRVIIALYRLPSEEKALTIPLPSITLSGSIALGVLSVLLVGLGIFPFPFINLIQQLAVGLK